MIFSEMDKKGHNESGKNTCNFYLLPTIRIYNGDGIYIAVELAWFNKYLRFTIR